MGAGDSALTEGVSELLLRSRSPAGGLGGLYAVTRKSPTVPHAGAGRHNPTPEASGRFCKDGVAR